MHKNAEISERITRMLEFLELKPAQFASKLGYDRAQTIYDIEKGRSKPSYDFFKRFVDAGFAELINIEWLISGKGPMVRNQKEVNDKSTKKEDADLAPVLIEYLKEKDNDIKQLAEEIGRLKAEISYLKNNADRGNMYVAEP